MHPIRYFIAVFCLVGVAAQAWADSCPYCGRVYGDPAPGDEARIYALRRDHELNCPDNPANRPAARGDDWDDSGSGVEDAGPAGYGVITLFNDSAITINFSIQATAGGAWTKGSVAPRSYYWYWQTEPASFSISFDWSFAPDLQERIYRLPHNTVEAHPKFSDGREYVFTALEDGIDLNTSTGRITERVRWDRENAERLRQQRLQEENDRFRAKIDNAMDNGQRAEDAENFKLALDWYKYAAKFFPPPPNIWMADPGISNRMTAADQKLRRQKGCNETHAKAKAAYERKDYAAALRLWDEASLYCNRSQTSIIDGWVRKAKEGLEKAKAEKQRYDEMLILNETGNELLAKKDCVGAYQQYQQALKQSDHPQVRDNLARARNECEKRAYAANDRGIALLPKDKFRAAVEFIVSMTYVLNPDHEKTVHRNLDRALAGLSPDDLDRLGQLTRDEIYALSTDLAAGSAGSTNAAPGNLPGGQVNPTGRTADPQSGVDSSTGRMPRSQLTEDDVNRKKAGILDKFRALQNSGFDGRSTSPSEK